MSSIKPYMFTDREFSELLINGLRRASSVGLNHEIEVAEFLAQYLTEKGYSLHRGVR